MERSGGLKSYPRFYFELIFVGFTLFMGMRLPAAFLPIFADELDPTGVLVGFVISAWFFSRIFIELPSGVLADRVGKRRLLVGGLALSAVGAFVCSMANSIYLLILGRTIWGLGTALFFMSNTAVILDLFKSSMRGRALGTFQGIEFIGSFIGAPIGGFIVGFIG
ncbi:MAG: MFS transporter [Candidatus Bathyarchaeia archaeon]